jgi:hypothetical protein
MTRFEKQSLDMLDSVLNLDCTQTPSFRFLTKLETELDKAGTEFGVNINLFELINPNRFTIECGSDEFIQQSACKMARIIAKNYQNMLISFGSEMAHRWIFEVSYNYSE